MSDNNNLNLFCWGYNYYGQLGVDSTTNHYTPVQVKRGVVPPGETVIQVATGSYSTCALTDAKKVYCWGYNAHGRLGKAGADKHAPQEIDLDNQVGLKFNKISMKHAHVCGLAEDKNVYCWGYNGYGGLGNNTATNSSVAIKVQLPAIAQEKVVDVSTGTYASCAVIEDGNIYCWGYGSHGQMGNELTTGSNKLPVKVYKGSMETVDGNNAGSAKFINVSVGAYNVCGRTEDKRVYCWGYNGYGELGLGHKTSQKKPTKPVKGDLGDEFNMGVAGGHWGSGYYRTCVITVDQQVACFGSNTYGSLGLGTTGNAATAQQIVPDKSINFAGDLDPNFVDVSLGSVNTCAKDDAGNSYCWGYSAASDNRLGNAAFTTTQSRPIDVDID
jgi:alpha-tubulin suppressor-like RCC1 family protein